MLSFLSNPVMLLLLKAVGAGGILKIVLSLQVKGKEIIDYLPATMQPWGAHVIAAAVYCACSLLTGAYQGPNFDTQFGLDLAQAGFTGAFATNIHNIITAYIDGQVLKATALIPPTVTPADGSGGPRMIPGA